MRILVLALLLSLLPSAAIAQSFPAKPLRIVVRAPPGGTDDLLGRFISQKMGEILGQPTIVDYRTGGGGLVAWEYVAKGPPDGYTILLAASGLGAIKSLRPEATIDPWRDFAWVSQVTNYQLALVVHPSLPAKTLKELIALARSRPGQLSYGSSGIGATPHFSAEYFKSAADVNILHVPYKGAGPMYVDLMYVPLVWTSGGAGGYVTRDAFERIVAEMVGMLSQQMPVDAIYLDLHGAAVLEDFEDAEGELLRRMRAAVGDRVPIVVSLDYHANVTRQMVELTDGLVGYWTYPHVDRVETGQRAARVMKTVLEQGRPAGRALRRMPFLLPLNAQCTMVDPSKAIIEKSAQLERGDQVLNVSYLAGFPPADLDECGPAVIVHAYTQAKADALADELAREIEGSEAKFAAPLLDPDEAVRQAMRIAAHASKPVVIADTQDNPGAGGSGDTTGLLEALVRNEAQGAVLGIFYDAEAAAAAHKAGEGADIRIALGGKFGPEGVKPYSAVFRVVRLGDGRMRTTGPSVGGRNIDLGPMALLRIDGVSAVVSSKRMQAHDQAPFRHPGVEPKEQKILALKSTVHFRADFQPIAEEVLVAVAPGGHVVDTTKYPFRKLRRGVRLHPLGPEFAGAARAG